VRIFRDLKVSGKYADHIGMDFPRFLNCSCKVGALVAASVLLPILAFAGTDNGNGNGGQNNGKQNGHISTVPDNGPGILLIAATIGGIMLFSARLSSRRKA